MNSVVSEALSDSSVDFQWVLTHIDRGQDSELLAEGPWNGMIPIQCRFYTTSVASHRIQLATPSSSSQLVSTGTALPHLRSPVTGVASNKLRQWLRTEINSCNLSLKVVHVMVSHAHTAPRPKGLGWKVIGLIGSSPRVTRESGFPRATGLAETDHRPLDIGCQTLSSETPWNVNQLCFPHWLFSPCFLAIPPLKQRPLEQDGCPQ